MNSRERVLTTLQFREPDIVPSFEAWIESDILKLMNFKTQYEIREHLQIDCMPIAANHPASTNAWRTGVDEWGRVFKNGQYVDGLVKTLEDLDKYTPPLSYAEAWFPKEQVKFARQTYSDTHTMYFADHNSCLTMTYMRMGLTTFFTALLKNPEFVNEVLDRSAQWGIALIEQALQYDPDFILLGDDVAYNNGPMISPKMLRDYLLPVYKKVVKICDVPLFWHSDGDIRSIIPLIKEAGFKGIHSLEPHANISLGEIKKHYGKDLVLLGNLDGKLLTQLDSNRLHLEIDKIISTAAPGGGFLFSSCNSLFLPMIPEMITEAYHYEKQIGKYGQKAYFF